ncbi:MAG: zinc-dependent metalloprotease family protein [Limnohabitans sp.]|nr:zinc-dependent metalloprotease family protein [Limnohabitans sp.]
MSYTINVGGKIIISAKGGIKTFAKEDIVLNAGKTISLKGEENGVSFGEPEDAPKIRIEPFHFPACVYFYRSKAQAEGKYGKLDKEYDGEFGFDTFDKKVCAEGTYTNYETIISAVPAEETVKDEKVHLTSYASLYPPNVLDNPNNTKSKITLYVLAKEDEKKKKDTHDVKFVSSNPNAIRIISNDTLTMTVGDKNPQPITIECIAPFDKDVEIKALGVGDVFPIGRLVIKANATRYKTTIQPVEVIFEDSSQSNSPSTGLITKTHEPFFKELEKKFNTKSFNQAYIYGLLASQTYQIKFNKSDFAKYFIEEPTLKKTYLIKKIGEDSDAKDFNKLVESKFANLLANIQNNKTAEIEIKVVRQIKKFLEIFDTKFDYKRKINIQYHIKKHQEKIATKAWNDSEVQKQYQEYLKLKKQLEQAATPIPLPQNEVLYLFYTKSLYGGTSQESIDVGIATATANNTSLKESNISTVYAYSLHESGICYIFDVALNNTGIGIDTIIHELGHSLGLHHTFETTLGKSEKRIVGKRYKEDIKSEINSLESKKKKKNETVNYESNCGIKYSRIKGVLERIENVSISLFEQYFLESLILPNEGALDMESNNEFFIGKSESSEEENLTIQDIHNKIKELEEEIKKSESLIIHNNWHEQSKTEENYMDYTQFFNKEPNTDFQYKRYTNKQWEKMQQIGSDKKYLIKLQ